jgi:hypothetical protein
MIKKHILETGPASVTKQKMCTYFIKSTWPELLNLYGITEPLQSLNNPMHSILNLFQLRVTVLTILLTLWKISI